MLYERLKKLPWKKEVYFKWRHDLEYRKHHEKKTEEEVIKALRVKTLNEYIKWETTDEYLELVNLALATRFAQDLEKAYVATADKARNGDEKAIKLMMDLQKHITAVNKQNNKTFKKNDTSAYDGLEL